MTRSRVILVIALLTLSFPVLGMHYFSPRASGDKPSQLLAGKIVQGDPNRLERIRKAVMPKFSKPIPFTSPEADAICSALEVFPPNNPWNLVVADWPLHANSKKIIASIGARKPLRYNPDMGFVLVPPDQKRVDVKIVTYPDESDKGPFPVPENIPIEGWPVAYKGMKLEDVQRKKEDGDRHALVVDPVNRILYEFYQLRRTDAGWQAAQASIFDLKTNKLRPDGWTSSDAAGLPIYPSVVRLRRIETRRDRARPARDGCQDPEGLCLSRDTLRQSTHRRELAAHGRADSSPAELRPFRILSRSANDPQGR